MLYDAIVQKMKELEITDKNRFQQIIHTYGIDDPKKLREKAKHNPKILITLMQNEFHFQTTNSDDPQLNELNPTPPNLTTTPLQVQVPHMWVQPRPASDQSFRRWLFANNYFYKLLMELYVCMQ